MVKTLLSILVAVVVAALETEKVVEVHYRYSHSVHRNIEDSIRMQLHRLVMELV